MAITPSDFSKIWASNADTPEYTFNEADYLKGWDFVGNLPPTRAQWNAMQKSTDEKMKYVFDNFGAPLTASTVAEMTMQNRVYVYTGSETGYTAGHWYYWNDSAWTDGGVYNSNTVQVDPTLTISGAAADAQVTGELKSALYTTINGVNKSFSVTQNKTNIFPFYFLKGVSYTVENHTGGAINFRLIQENGTEKIISGNLQDGNSVTFIPDRDDYIKFTSWVPAGATGTIDLSCDYSVLGITKENYETLNDYINSNNSFLKNSYYGTNKSFPVTAYKINVYNFVFLKGVKYTIINHTGQTINFKVVQENGTEHTVSSSLGNGNFVTFIPDRDDYVKFTSWVPADATGTIDVQNEFAIINQLLESNGKLNNLIELPVILTDGEIGFCASTYQLGAFKNNAGNATYIWNDVYESAVERGESVYIKCDNVVNAISAPFYLQQYNGDNEVLVRGYTLAQVQNGLVVKLNDGVDKIVFRLYASQTGGLVDTYAEFTGVMISHGTFGHPKINKNLLTDWLTPPSYYFENNYLNDKVEAILQIMESANGNYDAFVFCTDQHWKLNAQQSPKLIKYLSDHLCLPRMFMGGDYEDGLSFGAYRAFKESYSGRIYNIIGNHEYMDGQVDEVTGKWTARVNTDATIWACLNGSMYDAVLGDPSRNYYYVDNTVQKIRYIVLSIYTDGSEVDFDARQADWLGTVALNLPDDFTAVVFAHHIASVDHSTGELIFPSFAQTICNIVDSHSGAGKVACLIGGHTHFDGLGTTPGGIPVFVTTCDKYIPYSGGGEEHLSNRNYGTITEQAFDVFVINKNAETVQAIRVGCPANNPTGNPLEIRTANY